jgi:hypothetical protein
MGGIRAFRILSSAFPDAQMLALGWRIRLLSSLFMIGIGRSLHRAVEDTPKVNRPGLEGSPSTAERGPRNQARTATRTARRRGSVATTPPGACALVSRPRCRLVSRSLPQDSPTG